jgi:thiamine monophosphate kinase
VSRDEFQIIQRYFALPDNDPDVLLGIGDDARATAVVHAGTDRR